MQPSKVEGVLSPGLNSKVIVSSQATQHLQTPSAWYLASEEPDTI
jgi:hypothetical protein